MGIFKSIKAMTGLVKQAKQLQEKTTAGRRLQAGSRWKHAADEFAQPSDTPEAFFSTLLTDRVGETRYRNSTERAL